MGGTVLTEDQMRKEMGMNLYNAENQLYQVKRGWVDQAAKNILFKPFPAFTSPAKPPPPSGLMLTEDWQRVGYPPFNFLTC